MEKTYISDWDVRLATLAKMGGDITKHYASVYDIDLEILKLTGEGGGLEPVVVDTLPETGEAGKIYFVPNTEAGEKDNYKEYLWINNQWETVGNADVDLTDYLTKDEAAETYAKKEDIDIVTPFKAVKIVIGPTSQTSTSITVNDYNEIKAAIQAKRPILVQADYIEQRKAAYGIKSVDYAPYLAQTSTEYIRLNLFYNGSDTIDPFIANIRINSNGTISSINYIDVATKSFTDTTYAKKDEAYAKDEFVNIGYGIEVLGDGVDKASISIPADMIGTIQMLDSETDEYVDWNAYNARRASLAVISQELTQAEYDALEDKDPQTLYIITDAE